MAEQASATVKVDQNGRMYLPASTRRALEIHGQEAMLDLDVKIIERDPNE
jgi:bifunctional DNA-binding transcriptional regulator/antitoxin component of YhaV-PrlF toxin-antitoxin module